MISARGILIYRYTAATCAVALLLTTPPAHAQEGSKGSLEEIVVTARKREESILKVPVIESVLTQEKMQSFAVDDFQDVIAKIPGLLSGNASVTIGEQVSLRGVGSNAVEQGVDQSVSLNIDGLQITHGMAFRAATMDIAQVEVFKGPQALYYGKNSTAGVIAYRSADPGSTFELNGRYGYETEAEENRAEFVASGPVTDTLGLRLAGLYSKSDGFFYNKAESLPDSGAVTPRYDRFGGGESYLVRGTVLWQPADNFTVRLKANLANDEVHHGNSTQMASCPDGNGAVVVRPGFPDGIPFYPPSETCKYDRTLYIVDMDPAAFPGIRNNGRSFTDLEQKFGTLELNYDITPEIALSSTTGYYRLDADALMNGTATGYAGPSLTADNIFQRHENTEELRLSSDFRDSPVNFTLGAYYQDGEISNEVTLGGNTLYYPPATFPIQPGVLSKGISTIDIESISAFGQLRWQALEQLEVAGGVRWTDEKRELDVFNLLTGTAVALAPGSDRISSSNWSPEFTLTYTPTDDFTVFGAYKVAYKSGSFSIVTPAAPGDDKSFGDEKAEGGEVGIKSRWLERSLALNVGSYYYVYSGLQTGVNEPVSGSGLPILRTINAGKGEVYGLDMDLTYRPASIAGLGFNLAANWNKTKFLELNNVPCWGGQLVSQGCDQVLNPNTGRYTSQDLSGIPFVRAPEWQVNFGFDYEFQIGSDMRLVFANDNQYVDDYLAILGKRPDFYVSSYVKSDVSLTFYGPGDKWDVGFVANNVQNEMTPGFCNAFDAMAATLQPSLSGGTTRNASGVAEVGCAYSRGRSIWLRAGFSL